MPIVPIDVWTTDPVTHIAPSIAFWSAKIHDVTRIIATYVKIEAMIPKTISLNVFSAGNLNSSAACGILSNPTYIHGAIATIRMIDVHTPFSALNTGCAFSNEKSPTKNDVAKSPATTSPMNKQNMNCRLPDKPDPLDEIYANTTNTAVDRMTSMMYTSQPAIVYRY